MRPTRSQLLEVVETLIEEAVEEEALGGIAAEVWQALEGTDDDSPSQYEMWSALTALSQEVRLQGRAFKALDDTLGPVKDGLQGYDQAVNLAQQTANKAWEVAQQRLLEARREGEDRARQEFLGTLIEAHDRVSLGLESALACRLSVPPARAWWLGGGRQLALASEAVDSLIGGCRLSLESLTALLQRHQVTTVSCHNQPFDPHTMNAVAVEQTPTVPDGTVLEVLRPGYLFKGNLFRAAQVKVARQPNSTGVTSS